MPCSPLMVPPSASAVRTSSSAAASSGGRGTTGRIGLVDRQGERRVEVAVPGVGQGSRADAVGLADPGEGLEHLGQARGGHGDVLAQVHARRAALSAGAAQAPEVLGLVLVGDHAGRAAGPGEDPFEVRGLLLDAVAVELEEEDRLGAVGQARALGQVDVLEGAGIQRLGRGGAHGGAGDPADPVGGIGDGGEAGQDGPSRDRQGPQAHGRADRHGQGPLGADQRLGQVQARHTLDRAVPGADEGAVGQHHLEGQDRLAGHAVLGAVQAAGVGGDVAADARDAHARRVRGVEEAVLAGGGVEIRGDDARLDHGHAVHDVDLADPV